MTIDYERARAEAEARINAWLKILAMQERALSNARIAAAVRARARAAAPAVAFAKAAAKEVTAAYDALALARFEALRLTQSAAGARRAAWRKLRVALRLRCACHAAAAVAAVDAAVAAGAAAREARARAQSAAAAYARACAESERYRYEASVILYGGWSVAPDDPGAPAADAAVSTDALIAAVYSAAAPAIRAMRPRPRAQSGAQA